MSLVKQEKNGHEGVISSKTVEHGCGYHINGFGPSSQLSRNHLQKKHQTHKRLKRMLFIRTKHNLHMLGVISFIKL